MTKSPIKLSLRIVRGVFEEFRLNNKSLALFRPNFLVFYLTRDIFFVNRLALPAKFRDALAGGLMLTKGQDHCLFVFPRAEFEQMARKVAEAPFTNEAVRAYQRYLFAGTDEQRPDGQGRISIAPELRRYAGLSKECVVIGAITRLEIWDAQAWQGYLEEHEDSYAKAREEVLPGVF